MTQGKDDQFGSRGMDDDRLLAVVVRAANTPIFMIDMYGRLLYANPAATDSFRRDTGLLRGMSLARLLDLGNLSQVLRQLRESQPVEMETEVIHPDGTRAPIWVSLFPLHDSSADPPTAVGGILQGLSVQRQALSDAWRQFEELKLLNKVSLALSSSLELEQVLSILLEETRETLTTEACSVALLDAEKHDLFFLMAEGIGASCVRGTRMPADIGVIGWVVRNGQPLIVPDVDADPRFFPGIDNLTGERTRSLMCMPLEVRGTIIGALETMNKRSGDFDDEDLRVFKLIAASAATAISNALLYQHQRDTAEELLAKNHELIENREREIRDERLTVINQIGTSIHHEINNPLTAILGLSDWILKRDDLPEDLAQELSTMREQAIRIRDIVRRLSQLNHDRTINYHEDQKMIDLSG